MTKWSDHTEFLSDKEVKYIGYQANFKSPLKGLFMFLHSSRGCNTTLAFKIKDFADTIGVIVPDKGPLRPESHNCQKYCLNQEEVRSCSNEGCPGIVIREMIDKILKMQRLA